MEEDWIEYQCKSGQTMFVYNKVTGEHKWPHGLGENIKYTTMHGRPVTYKEFNTIGIQTEDNGCNNGCMSMYISTDSTHAIFQQPSDGSNAQISFAVTPGPDNTTDKRHQQKKCQRSGMVMSSNKKAADSSDCGHSKNRNTDNHCHLKSCYNISEIVRDVQEGMKKHSVVKILGGKRIGNDDGYEEYGNDATNSDYSNEYVSSGDYNSKADANVNNVIVCSNSLKDYHQTSDDYKVGMDDESNVDSNNKSNHGDDSNISGIDVNIISNNVGSRQDHIETVHLVGVTEVCYPEINKTDKHDNINNDVQGCGEKTDQHINDEVNIAEKKQYKKRSTNAIQPHHECHICKMVFESKLLLKRHFLVHAEEKTFECNYCNKKFVRKSSLSVHLRTHTGENLHECSFCEKTFPQKTALIQHMRTHTNEKPYECSYCHAKLSHKSSLNVHIMIHTGEKQFECSVCKKQFRHKHSFNTHVKTHSGERPYECNVCHKKFRHQSHLKTHVGIHEDLRPFECSVCKKKFSQRSNLKTHFKLHSGEKPFECSVCKKKFTQKHHLNSHKVHNLHYDFS